MSAATVPASTGDAGRGGVQQPWRFEFGDLKHELDSMVDLLASYYRSPAELLLNFVEHRSHVTLKYSSLIPPNVLQSAKALNKLEGFLVAASRRSSAIRDLLTENPLRSYVEELQVDAYRTEPTISGIASHVVRCERQTKELHELLFLKPNILNFALDGNEEMKLCRTAGGTGYFQILEIPRSLLRQAESIAGCLERVEGEYLKIAGQHSELSALRLAKSDLEARLAQIAQDHATETESVKRSHAAEMESLKDSNRNLKTELIAAKGFSGLPAEWDGRQLADLTARRAPRDEEDAYADSADIAHADADAHAGLDLDAASSSLELIPVAASRQRRNNISGYGPGPGVAIGGERVHGPGSVAITVAASTRPPAALSRRSKPTAKSPFLAAALSAFRQFFYTDNGARGPQQFRFCYILILVGAIITAVTLAVGFVAQDGWTIAAVNVAVGALLLILLTRGHYAHCRCWDFG